MKSIPLYLIVGIFVMQLGTAQEEITYPLDGFTTLKGFDGLSINLIKSDEDKAVIRGENTKRVALVNKAGVLKIRMKIDKIFSGYKTFVDVYHSQELKVLDVNEDAEIFSEATYVQDVLELKAQEGGRIRLNCETEQLLVKSVTGGDIRTNGSSENQDIILNTGGIYEGKEFRTKFTTIKVNAGGNASVYAINYVNANVKAGGMVKVYGDPLKMDEKTIFGGKIIRVE